MKNEIKLKNCLNDFVKYESFDCKNEIKIVVFSDVDVLLVCNREEEKMEDANIFSLLIACGENALMYKVPINEIELFASSVLKQIEIIRKSYGEQIKMQYDMGCDV